MSQHTRVIQYPTRDAFELGRQTLQFSHEAGDCEVVSVDEQELSVTIVAGDTFMEYDAGLIDMGAQVRRGDELLGEVQAIHGGAAIVMSTADGIARLYLLGELSVNNSPAS